MSDTPAQHMEKIKHFLTMAGALIFAVALVVGVGAIGVLMGALLIGDVQLCKEAAEERRNEAEEAQR